MNGGKGVFDSFRVEEAYDWRDDIMEITRRIVHETDEARLNNIAEHFKVDLSEIREFLEMKRKKMKKPQTKGDMIRGMSDEELAEWFDRHASEPLWCVLPECPDDECVKCILDWLKSPGGEGKGGGAD